MVLTGHTGFKGSWMAFWLHRMGATVTGISLPPSTDPNLFSLADIQSVRASHYCDIRDAERLARLVKAARPEIVIHMAAQALVRASYREPLQTFSTNVMGTAHVLDALRGLGDVRVAVIVTTDKVYRNHELHRPFSEDDELGGHDPYSASKAASEIVVASYREAFLSTQGVALATARAGNVMGGGDWSEDRLIPDAVRAWSTGRTLDIRHPDAVRPWQHVLEPLAGYLTLAQKLWIQSDLAGAYNFGPATTEAATVRDVVEMARVAYGSGEVRYDDYPDGPHEASWLALEIAKAGDTLGFTPKWTLRNAIQRTMSWYAKQESNIEARALCEKDIDAYEASA